VLERVGWILVLTIVAAGGAAGTARGETLDEAVERIAPELIELRHRIHQNPELGFREVETAALVVEHLRALGFEEIRTGVAHTGVVAVLRGGKPGPVVAVRADMDALPVTEQTSFPFKSTKRDTYEGLEVGVAHACGHDIHTSVQLGVASVLAGMRDELPGTVKFIFQPAEEGPPPGEKDGAVQMVEAGVLEDPAPEAIFGLHSDPSLEVGEAGYTEGAALAAVDRFRVRILGKQSHGAQPHLGVDPVVMGSQAVTALQTIRSRNLSPLAPSVVTVGIFRGGARYNIIPDEVRLEGTVRSFDSAVSEQVERRMHEILSGITAAGGGGYEMAYERLCPPTINDPDLTRKMVPVLEGVLGKGRVRAMDPMTAGEDFAFFSNIVPGLYYRLGVRAPGTESGELHTPEMTAADGAISVGIRAMTTLLLEYLHQRAEL
jgi:amidohydrolase